MAGINVAIALGSNLGDRRAHLQFALSELAHHISALQVSPVLETEPFEVPDPQPPYLNAVAVGETALDAEPLLAVLLDIEQRAGRRRTTPRAPRTLDLDLILFGDQVIDAPGLTVPHPRFRVRTFVLGLLAELVPDWKDPVTGQTMAELARRTASRSATARPAS